MPLIMWNCHCLRCRRARSAAHGTNIFYKLPQFRWTRGESQVVDYKLPEARFFGAAFCKRCGGSVARPSKERNNVVVPAGSLDTDPPAFAHPAHLHELQGAAGSRSRTRCRGIRKHRRHRRSNVRLERFLLGLVGHHDDADAAIDRVARIASCRTAPTMRARPRAPPCPCRGPRASSARRAALARSADRSQFV